MERIAIIGSSGSGKSRLAREVGTLIGAEVFDLDNVILEEKNGTITKPPAEIYRQRVQNLVDIHKKWVIEGVYPKVADIVWANADVLVWLDLPFEQTRGRYDVREAKGETKGAFQDSGVHEQEHNRLRSEYERLIKKNDVQNLVHVVSAKQDILASLKDIN